MKGIIEKEINGKTVNFHFGSLMFMYCEERGISVKELQVHAQDKAFTTVVSILFDAAKAYATINKQKFDFTLADASLWVDEIGIGEAYQMIGDALNTTQKKTPEEVGQDGQSGNI